MPRVTSRDTSVNITHTVDVELDESEYKPTVGDRKRGSSEHRPARIVGFDLKYSWDPIAQRWDLEGWRSRLHVQQQKQDDTWSESRDRVLPHEDRPAYEADWAPTITPQVTW